MTPQDVRILLDAISGALELQKCKRGRKRVLNEWELEFLNGVEVMISRGKGLSDAQGKTLEGIYRHIV